MHLRKGKFFACIRRLQRNDQCSFHSNESVVCAQAGLLFACGAASALRLEDVHQMCQRARALFMALRFILGSIVIGPADNGAPLAAVRIFTIRYFLFVILAVNF